MASEVVQDVVAERCRQDEKWGWPKPFPTIGRPGEDSETLKIINLSIEIEMRAREIQNSCASSWCSIAAEEFGEVMRALLARDPVALRLELIQLAAVCCAWAQAIDERLT